MSSNDPLQPRSRELGFPTTTWALPTAAGTLRIRAPRSQADVLGRRPAALRRAEVGEGPHWARPWAAGIGLARALARSAGSLDGLEVWDIGCGLGTAGIAAGLRGARVVFADSDADALRFAAHNAQRNGLSDVDVRPFDWFHDRPATSAAVLLLADVCYSYRHARAVERLVTGATAAGVGVVLADPCRATANDAWSRLDDHGGAGLRLAVAPARPGGERVVVRILEIPGRSAIFGGPRRSGASSSSSSSSHPVRSTAADAAPAPLPGAPE